MAPISIRTFFGRLRDPRLNRRKRHLLVDIIAIALCAVIAGANDWQGIAVFGNRRLSWLRTFLALPNGIPSHDTFERVFDRIDPQAFLACFQRWIDAIGRGLGLGHIAIDGKALRHSGNQAKDWRPLHVVSAWATECQLTLGQMVVDAKSNEITAIPQLLELLDIHGALVTIDAMGCQKEIAKAIVAGGGDYVLSVKDNQPKLLEDIQLTLEKALDNGREGTEYEMFETKDNGHGRKETRTYVIVPNVTGIRNYKEWEKLTVVGMYTTSRVVQGKRTDETHYFIGSRSAPAAVYGNAIRGHWGIENSLHWQMDVNFGEDASRVQKRRGGANLALLRRLALALVRRHPEKLSVACKRLSAALDTAFLEEILLAGINLGTL
jgi:predicted transposase YbfD/YdcC